MKIKKLISSILLCTVLAGCSDSNILNEIPLEQANCPISTLRTGTERQGIKTYGNGFECTQDGSYFMYDGFGGGSWLLYIDHGSDTVIKLCGRPDCNHTGSDCNAYFDSAKSVCYYNGFLYTFNISSGDVIRLNLDGTERITTYNISSFERAHKYSGRFNQKIFNGILFVDEMKINENGEQEVESFYYKLDGSMDEPKPIPFGFYMKADGESFVGIVDYDNENEIFTYGIWDPDKGVVSELFKAEDPHTHGYIGTKAEYYVENGIIIENTYSEGKKELVDTGLKGQYQLVCFPDCMVIYKYITTEEINDQGVTLDEATLYFYDWDYNDLGSVKINYQFNEILLGAGIICGETPERIILTDDLDCFPRYYINKSDFGTGNIEIHAFNVPDFGEEED